MGHLDETLVVCNATLVLGIMSSINRASRSRALQGLAGKGRPAGELPVSAVGVPSQRPCCWSAAVTAVVEGGEMAWGAPWMRKGTTHPWNGAQVQRSRVSQMEKKMGAMDKSSVDAEVDKD